MKIKKLKISNLRGLKKIEFKPNDNASVIVGPNAVGKTTLLESIRILKGLLMPTFLGEEQEIMNSIGGRNQQNNKIKLEYILGDISQPLEISATIEFNDEEIKSIIQQTSDLAILRLRHTVSFQSGISDVQMIQFLSSPNGQQLLEQATQQIIPELKRFETSKTVSPTLIIGTNGQIRGKSLFDQEVISLLASSLPPSMSFFSYFPADRSLPLGETNIQLGSQEANQQLRAHIANPHTKYSRLKQYIVNQSLDPSTLEELKGDFDLVFENLLPGKKLDKIHINPYGNFSVAIKEIEKNTTYDIDQMSSGEKGLILTFFLMKRTVAKGGIILIDEPEIHLNPAVQKKILPFLIDKVSNYSDSQIIICTHSPEILAAAFENPQCSLFHLKSSVDISPIYSEDKKDVFEALKRLGASTSDVLSSRGSFFVEGENDMELLEFGFQKKLSGIKIIELGGRLEVEKEIKRLQEEEKKGKLDSFQFFLFDKDRNLTNLQSTPKVRISQWKRYCFENYLLDSDAIYDACQSFNCRSAIPSRGELPALIKTLALDQIKYVVAREVYHNYNYESCGLRSAEVDKAKNFEEISIILLARISLIKEQFGSIETAQWKQSFIEKCLEEERILKQKWEDKYLNECNGKIVLEEIFKRVTPNTTKFEFKKRILLKMEERKSDNWSIIDSFISNLLTI